MYPKHKKLLRSQRLFLAEELLDDMIIQFIPGGDVNGDSVRPESSNRKKTLKLLFCCSRAFHHFIQSLEKDFPWSKDKLLRLFAEDTESPPPSFTVQCGVPDHILPTVPTTQHLNRLAARLTDPYRGCADHPLAVQSQVLAGLVMWTQRNGREATVRRLLQSLQATDTPPSVLQQVFV
uniref:Death domain-containing protein n=1 Tax=Cyprinus carpio TaxID=7962 RepID=A0A8C1XQ91_CYPCA